MPGLVGVLAGMLVLGRVAAPDVAAGKADPKVHPAVARAKAVFAAVHRFRRVDGDLVEMGADGHVLEDRTSARRRTVIP